MAGDQSTTAPADRDDGWFPPAGRVPRLSGGASLLASVRAPLSTGRGRCDPPHSAGRACGASADTAKPLTDAAWRCWSGTRETCASEAFSGPFFIRGQSRSVRAAAMRSRCSHHACVRNASAQLYPERTRPKVGAPDPRSGRNGTCRPTACLLPNAVCSRLIAPHVPPPRRRWCSTHQRQGARHPVTCHGWWFRDLWPRAYPQTGGGLRRQGQEALAGDRLRPRPRACGR